MPSSIAMTSFSVAETCSANRFNTVATATCDLVWLRPVLRRTCSTINAPSPSGGHRSDNDMEASKFAACDCPSSSLVDKSVVATSGDNLGTEFEALACDVICCGCGSEEERETLAGGCGAVAFRWMFAASPAAQKTAAQCDLSRSLHKCQLLKTFIQLVNILLLISFLVTMLKNSLWPSLWSSPVCNWLHSKITYILN